MSADRDVTAFDRRANSYDQGARGRLHHDLSDRVIEQVVTACRQPARVLDVGCGTGYALRALAGHWSGTQLLVGVDPAPGMLAVARSATSEARVQFAMALAEHLPFGDAAFDVVVTTTSFDHWADQRAGLRECARVLAPGGQLVMTDLVGVLLTPSLLVRRGKARTRRRVQMLLRDADLDVRGWNVLHRGLISSVTARRP